jgi:hypothetical protein
MIELELLPLKYEVNYKDKCYIIEAIDYFNDTDETKWTVKLNNKYYLTKEFNLNDDPLLKLNLFTLNNKYYLTKEFNLNDDPLLKLNLFTFNTKDEAINALTVYLLIEDRLEKERAQYIKEINIYKQALKLKDFRDKHQFDYKNEYFMSLKVLENNLRSKNVKFIDLSRADYLGVQVRVSTIKEMLILEQAIKDIEEDNNNYYTVVNYTNEGVSVISYNWPLYYYWQVGDEFVRHFAFIKKEEYID